MHAGDGSAALAALTPTLDGKALPVRQERDLWAAFLILLAKRGYFTASPTQLEAAFGEIAQVGEGFDLYDLARRLARYDADAHGSPSFPALGRFAPDRTQEERA
jgi:hypothetical protein